MTAIAATKLVAGLQGLATLPWADISGAAAAEFKDPEKDVVAAEDVLGFFALFFPGLQIAEESLAVAALVFPLLVASTGGHAIPMRDEPQT